MIRERFLLPCILRSQSLGRMSVSTKARKPHLMRAMNFNLITFLFLYLYTLQDNF